jgi:predicted GH43/DUF377 family glycosyl hydrolase
MTGKAAAIRSFCISVSGLLLAGCGHYADFTLPALAGSQGIPQIVRNAVPVLEPTPGAWDSRDVLNPSVVLRDGRYLNFYSGFDGHTWHTGLAESSNGTQWRKVGRVLSPDPRTWEGSYIAANGSALYYEGRYWYWYQAGPRERPQIGLARSADLRKWTKESQPVVPLGPLGSWDERAVADPYVVSVGEWLYLYYLGQDRARVQRLGLARSHDGIRWEKLRSNPILEPATGAEENGLGEPAVWQKDNSYWMLYTGRDAHEVRTLGLASSADGVHWRRLKTITGEGWNAKVLCDPTVIVHSGQIELWFGGGDVASPDENLHGQIGTGWIQ